MSDKQMSKESMAHHLEQMRAMEGWQVLVVHWNAERERIISEGKKARSEQKRTEVWAELSGFDRAATMAEKIVKLGEVRKQLEEATDDA